MDFRRWVFCEQPKVSELLRIEDHAQREANGDLLNFDNRTVRETFTLHLAINLPGDGHIVAFDVRSGLRDLQNGVPGMLVRSRPHKWTRFGAEL